MNDPVLVAKFKMHSREQEAHYQEPGKVNAERVKLGAVYGKDGTANARWAKATPTGELTMRIENPDAIGLLKLGQSYKVYLVPCGEDE